MATPLVKSSRLQHPQTPQNASASQSETAFSRTQIEFLFEHSLDTVRQSIVAGITQNPADLNVWCALLEYDKSKPTLSTPTAIRPIFEAALAHVPMHANRNTRDYISLWLEYARLLTEEEDIRNVYKKMRTERIGSDDVRHYVDWARFELRFDNVEKAQQILDRAVERKVMDAAKSDALIREFTRREQQQSLSASQSQSQAASLSSQHQPQSSQLSMRRTAGSNVALDGIDGESMDTQVIVNVGASRDNQAAPAQVDDEDETVVKKHISFAAEPAASNSVSTNAGHANTMTNPNSNSASTGATGSTHGVLKKPAMSSMMQKLSMKRLGASILSSGPARSKKDAADVDDDEDELEKTSAAASVATPKDAVVREFKAFSSALDRRLSSNSTTSSNSSNSSADRTELQVGSHKKLSPASEKFAEEETKPVSKSAVNGSTGNISNMNLSNISNMSSVNQTPVSKTAIACDDELLVNVSHPKVILSSATKSTNLNAAVPTPIRAPQVGHALQQQQQQPLVSSQPQLQATAAAPSSTTLAPTHHVQHLSMGQSNHNNAHTPGPTGFASSAPLQPKTPNFQFAPMPVNVAPMPGLETITVNGVQYAKLECVGRGGSCKVFKVLGPDRKIYALKKVKLAGLDKPTIDSFINEVNLLQQLQGNEYVVNMQAAEITPDRSTLHVVMEFGETDLNMLLTKQANKQGLGENFVRLYWQQMLEAVHVVHEHRIIHADLKPSNFLVVAGQLKLIDFGIARAIQNDTTNVVRENQVGTINYMSPEAIAKSKQSRSTDIWSLGCILYQLAYGRPPFAHLNTVQKIAAITDDRHEIAYPETHHSSQLLDVLKACLQRDPVKRPSIPQLLSHAFLCSEKASTVQSSALTQQQQQQQRQQQPSVDWTWVARQMCRFGSVDPESEKGDFFVKRIAEALSSGKEVAATKLETEWLSTSRGGVCIPANFGQQIAEKRFQLQPVAQRKPLADISNSASAHAHGNNNHGQHGGHDVLALFRAKLAERRVAVAGASDDENTTSS